MPTLSVIILTKNEEDNIASVVANAWQYADEVLVVDSGSTDQTVALAQESGARTTLRAWDADFAAQRNFGRDEARGDWIFYLDADERITPRLGEAVRRAIEEDARMQYAMERKSVAFGTKFSHGVLRPDHVARLFPREAVTWQHKVHEHPDCPLPLKRLPGYLEHHTYKDWHHWEEKLCRYTAIWAEEAYRSGRRVSLAGIFLHSLGGFIKMFLLRLGFLDGWMGTYLCCTHFFYEMLKYLKLYEKQRMDGIHARSDP